MATRTVHVEAILAQMIIDPQVSIVMSLYNGEARYLRVAVESVLAQKEIDFEFIIVNDGSTDGSAAIVEQYARQDQRIRLIHQQNTGLTRALIHGCREARGKYIARQDGDDLSLPRRFIKQAKELEGHPEVAFVSSWGEVLGPENEILQLYSRPTDSRIATEQLLQDRIGPPGHGSVMMRRSAYEQVGGYRPQFYYAQDSELWLRLGMIGRISYVPEVLYQYRISEASMSGALHEDKLPFIRLIDELHEARRAGKSEEPILARAAVVSRGRKKPRASSQARTLYFIGKCLYDRRDPRARNYFLKAIKTNPFHWRARLRSIECLIRHR